uniref:CIDE-N domain-containing protein n=1 Tax=Esox lucius TaxID=8010 RepID=A0A3P8XMF2_ESOLU
MDYAMKSLSLLSPSSLSKCVTASVSASASMTQQLLCVRAARPKPFRVTSADRTIKKGIMADGLQDLLNKAIDSLRVSCVTLVLDEDGTGVDTEEFFLTLTDNTVLMVLEKGQLWTPPKVYDWSLSMEGRVWCRKNVARITFDLYKNNPQDFIGCLNVKATLYGTYSVSYDVRCYAAKNILKEALRWTLFSMQATGHILLGSSCYIEQLLEEEERAAGRLPLLPQDGKMKQLQSILMGRAAV